MIKFFIILLSFSFLLVSCSNKAPKEKEQPQAKEMADVVHHNSIDITAIQFASKKDTICGMPIKMGVADTLNIKGKIYGFCATECKEAFKKQLAKK